VLAGLDRVLAVVTWVAAALVVAALFAGPALIGAEKEGAAAAPAPAGEAPAAAPAGQAVFDSNCSSCHTLAAADANGAVGPNLDERKPDAARVESIVTSGGGTMPSFNGQLSAAEIKAVAEFVATSAGR
jgi:mono/diheme cytochrome c family protein